MAYIFRPIIVLFTLCLLLLGGANTAPAQTIDTKGAVKLRTIFQTFIDNQKKTFVPAMGVSLMYDGRVSVEQTGTYYAVTLPHIKILYNDGRIFDIGMISVNAVPDRTPGRWRMTAAMPTPMVVRGADGKVIKRIVIGSQKSMGVWDERLKGFINFDGVYNDVALDGGAYAYGARIPELKARYDFSTNAIRMMIGEAVFELVLSDGGGE